MQIERKSKLLRVEKEREKEFYICRQREKERDRETDICRERERESKKYREGYQPEVTRRLRLFTISSSPGSARPVKSHHL